MCGVSLPSDPSCVTNVSVPSTLKIGAMMTIWLSSRCLRGADRQIARDHQQRLGRLGLGRMDVAEQEDDRLAGRARLLRRGDPRIGEHDRRRHLPHRADEHVDDVERGRSSA